MIEKDKIDRWGAVSYVQTRDNRTHPPSAFHGTSNISDHPLLSFGRQLTSPVFSSTVTMCPRDSWRSFVGTPRLAMLEDYSAVVSLKSLVFG